VLFYRRPGDKELTGDKEIGRRFIEEHLLASWSLVMRSGYGLLKNLS
jgi:hypothetical protein